MLTISVQIVVEMRTSTRNRAGVRDSHFQTGDTRNQKTETRNWTKNHNTDRHENVIMVLQYLQYYLARKGRKVLNTCFDCYTTLYLIIYRTFLNPRSLRLALLICLIMAYMS